MNIALAEQSAEDDETIEDENNRIIESRKMLGNGRLFALTRGRVIGDILA